MDIKYEYETKFLGLHLAKDMMWDVHIKHLISKLNRSALNVKQV
jgi:hypothetical protein